MEACTTEVAAMIEVPEIVPVQTETAPVQAAETPRRSHGLVRAASVVLAFSMAFSASFVVGFYGLGPWIDSVRTLM